MRHWKLMFIGLTCVMVGCEPTVRSTLLNGFETGIQAIISAVIQAMFTSAADTAMLDPGILESVGMFV